MPDTLIGGHDMKPFSRMRRRFLKAAAVAPLVVTATAVSQKAEAYDPGADERRARYQPDAADVQAFYRTNGYETLKK